MIIQSSFFLFLVMSTFLSEEVLGIVDKISFCCLLYPFWAWFAWLFLLLNASWLCGFSLLYVMKLHLFLSIFLVFSRCQWNGMSQKFYFLYNHVERVGKGIGSKRCKYLMKNFLEMLWEKFKMKSHIWWIFHEIV